jgi:hypothetical protein
LIVATDLPSYIKGNFNLHSSGEEFTQQLDNTWINFYTRNTLNENFACRPNDPRLTVNGVPKCTTGDTWRAAAVISDAMTLLSDSYRLGFRNEGDYDWNNNSSDPASITSRTINDEFGLPNRNFLFNTYAPSTLIPTTPQVTPDPKGLESIHRSDRTGWRAGLASSYFYNFVTPVVRQTKGENISYLDYAYEICDTTKYTDCNSPTGDPKHYIMTNVAYNGFNYNGQNSWRNNGDGIEGQPVASWKTGSIGSNPATGWNNPAFLRRVAFKRDVTTGAEVSPRQVYGVDSQGRLQAFLASDKKNIRQVKISGYTTTVPWLKLDSNYQWKPVLWNSRLDPTVPEYNNTWLQQPTATDTTYNVIIAAGDTPARTTEDNGALQNYARFAENWVGKNARISGSFMQLRKSSYATAPFVTSLTSSTDTSLIYSVSNGGSRLPFYDTPNRLWGYDVGILSQSPDLFSQKLVIPIGDLPNEYFREVGRDDPWVQNLLCAKNGEGTSAPYVIDPNQRPSICQS